MLLAGAWAVVRFAFFDAHGMKDWPAVLAVVGLVALILTWVTRTPILGYVVPVGYLVGYAIGEVLGTEGTDPGGGRTSTGWWLWTVGFLAILVGTAIARVLLVRRRPG